MQQVKNFVDEMAAATGNPSGSTYENMLPSGIYSYWEDHTSKEWDLPVETLVMRALALAGSACEPVQKPENKYMQTYLSNCLPQRLATSQ